MYWFEESLKYVSSVKVYRFANTFENEIKIQKQFDREAQLYISLFILADTSSLANNINKNFWISGKRSSLHF